MPKKITVLGSINMDLVTKTDTIPKVGETVKGTSFFMNPGGKGANQAVAAAKLGADISLIGCIGDDEFGNILLSHLAAEGISTDYIKRVSNVSTGIASITLSASDNSIIVVSGANDYITPKLVEEYESIIAESDILLLQLEVPLLAVEKAVELAKKHDVLVILNPAPIQPLSENLLKSVDFLIPNEHEQKELFKYINSSIIEKKCIITRGSKGVSFYQNDKEVHIPSLKVDVLDTTGAGDSFNGAFAVALSEGKDTEEACHFANIVGALTVTNLGAQTGMPTRKVIQTFCIERGIPFV